MNMFPCILEEFTGVLEQQLRDAFEVKVEAEHETVGSTREEVGDLYETI